MGIWHGPTPARVYKGAALATAVYKGTVEVWRAAPNTVTVTATGNVVVPSWAALADVVVLGGGGGGHGGNGGNTTAGNGGDAGQWSTATIAVTPGAILAATIGVGGAAGAKDATGQPGGSTSVGAVTAAGGAAGQGYGGAAGASPGNREFNGQNYIGGGTAGNMVAGSEPGGGGGPGNGGIFGGSKPGMAGGKGRAWLRFRSF